MSRLGNRFDRRYPESRAESSGQVGHEIGVAQGRYPGEPLRSRVGAPSVEEIRQRVDELVTEVLVDLLAALDELAPPAVAPAAQRPAFLVLLLDRDSALIGPPLARHDCDRASTKELRRFQSEGVIEAGRQDGRGAQVTDATR